MDILVICPSGAVAAPLERLQLLGDRTERVTVVTWDAPDTDDIDLAITLGKPVSALSQRISRMLSSSAPGRNLLRLTPLDGGRRLARAAREDPRLAEAARTADLLVVLERDGILTGWRATRRWLPASAQAVYGLAPAETLLKIQRAAA